MNWQTLAVAIGVVSPLVAVPLTVVGWYLRAIRDNQIAKYDEASRRADAIDEALQRLAGQVRNIERDYATKEEWLRESMQARARLERLTEMLVRVDAELEASRAASTSRPSSDDHPPAARTQRRDLGNLEPTSGEGVAPAIGNAGKAV